MPNTVPDAVHAAHAKADKTKKTTKARGKTKKSRVTLTLEGNATDTNSKLNGLHENAHLRGRAMGAIPAAGVKSKSKSKSKGPKKSKSKKPKK